MGTLSVHTLVLGSLDTSIECMTVHVHYLLIPVVIYTQKTQNYSMLNSHACYGHLYRRYINIAILSEH